MKKRTLSSHLLDVGITRRQSFISNYLTTASSSQNPCDIVHQLRQCLEQEVSVKAMINSFYELVLGEGVQKADI